MSDRIEDFYDSLASAYHLIFDDWDSAIARQGSILNAVLKHAPGNKLGSPLAVHDCACGIGTQALGLAALGHKVSGSDISKSAVQRATREAAERALDVQFTVSDMTTLAEFPSCSFDVIGAFDNALPHLSAAELMEATRAFRRVLRPGGIFVSSIRDYDELIRTRPAIQGPSFFGTAQQRRIVHQVWDWTSSDTYDVHLYISLALKKNWETLHFHSRYRCLLRAEANEALRSAGFSSPAWLMPAESGYYQPIMLARSP